MIVIKEPHALKVSFVTVMLKARHHCVSWGNCVAVFVCVPGLFCFHQWVSLSLLVVVLGVYFCWSLTLCPRHTHTQMHTHMGTYTVHTHRYTHTHMGTYTVHTHTGTHAHTHGHIHSAQTHRYTCSHTWAHTQCTHTHRCTRTHTWAHTQVHTQAWVHTVSSQPPFPDVSTSHSLPLSPFPSLHITFSSFANVYFQCSTRPTPLEPEKIILLNTEKYV